MGRTEDRIREREQEECEMSSLSGAQVRQGSPLMLGGCGARPMQEANPQAIEPTYHVGMSRTLVRLLAKLSPEANRKLRAQVPHAFIGDVVPVGLTLGGVRDPRGSAVIYNEHGGQYAEEGLHLDSRYTWEIVPCVDGVGSTLIARERI